MTEDEIEELDNIYDVEVLEAMWKVETDPIIKSWLAEGITATKDAIEYAEQQEIERRNSGDYYEMTHWTNEFGDEFKYQK